MKKRKFPNYVVMLSLLFTGLASAGVTEEDFKAKSTRNLINLCTASPQDVHYGDAIHFCHGYLVGAFHYHTSAVSNDPNKQLVCFPDPKPSRNESINMFVAWALNHPEFMNEVPVDTEFRFLAEKFPCKK
ncbi:Rap1a/Tai family immunity protein [Methyloglobulus sp.]|uniref:Rap1a/Tai family immunity protein n=1 Tax=Methyloglobulus sp. TaxID=2518622 RepID=UPI00398A1F7E